MRATKYLMLPPIAAITVLVGCGPKPAADAPTSAAPAAAESPAGAISDISGMSSMSGMAMATSAKTGSGLGTITAIDKTNSMVTIKHEAIPSVGWPAMTMAFKATPANLLDGRKVGDSVAFDVKVDGTDASVTAISPK